MTEPEEQHTLGDDRYQPTQAFSWGQLIGAFILTLVAVPLLFVATCIPGAYIGFEYYPWVFAAIFVGGAIVMAVRTDDSGKRWGIIAGVVAVGLITAYALWTWGGANG